MIVSCPECNKKFIVKDEMIPPKGRNLQCGSCNRKWFYKIPIKEELVEKVNPIIDLNKVEDCLKKDSKIKAILPVHFGGQSVDMKSLNFLSDRFGVFILEDAAHALETISNIGKVGNTDNGCAFSFYSNNVCDEWIPIDDAALRFLVVFHCFGGTN